MAKNKGTGVYQLPNGYWAFRYVLTSNKQRKEVRKSKDELGNPFKTQNQAIAARKIALEREHAHRVPIETSVSKSILPRKTVAEVYGEYCELGRSGKAYTTILKYSSDRDTLRVECKSAVFHADFLLLRLSRFGNSTGLDASS